MKHAAIETEPVKDSADNRKFESKHLYFLLDTAAAVRNLRNHNSLVIATATRILLSVMRTKYKMESLAGFKYDMQDFVGFCKILLHSGLM